MNSSIAIIFEGNEIPLGIKMMGNLLEAMKMNGAEGIRETEQWLKKIKTKQMNGQISRYVN